MLTTLLFIAALVYGAALGYVLSGADARRYEKAKQPKRCGKCGGCRITASGYGMSPCSALSPRGPMRPPPKPADIGGYAGPTGRGGQCSRCGKKVSDLGWHHTAVHGY